MDYCDDCGGIIVAEKSGDETAFKCRSCGKKYEKEGEELEIREESETESKEITVGNEDESLPTTDEECDECGNDEAYWWTEQTRSADEPPTRFYKCTECDHTWRVYD
ncbi:MAG: transcription factor S [Candidatus Nanohaloarchaea archaeon]